MSDGVRESAPAFESRASRVGKEEEAEEEQQTPQHGELAAEHSADDYARDRSQVAKAVGTEVHLYRPREHHVEQRRGETEFRVDRVKPKQSIGERPRLLRAWIALPQRVSIAQHLDLGHVAVRGIQESAATPCRDLLSPEAIGVTAIGMEITPKKHDDAVPEDSLLEKGEVLLIDARIELVVFGLVDPVRLGRAENHLRVGAHELRDVAEVLELRLVDVGIELDVGADQPPVVWKLACEVAHRLVRLPPREPSLAAAAEDT